MRQDLIGVIGATGILLFLRDRRQRRRTERLAAASLETLLRAIDANDAATGAHMRRVAWYATLLAREAGLHDRQVNAVERVALFHDVGKIHAALFDIVHDDDDKLSPEERERITSHPERGAEVLRPLSVFYPELAEGVLSHHERWDGTGYPRGLAGARIPLTSRLVAIADSFDAMTADRGYSGARPLDEAWRTIADGRASHFDPRLADLFLSADVRGRVEGAMRRMAARPLERERRGSVDREPAPDVTFRWRDAAAAPPPPDRKPRTQP